MNYIKSCCGNHFNYPNSICRHAVPGLPSGNTSETDVITIAKPRERKIYVAPGPVCENVLTEYAL